MSTTDWNWFFSSVAQSSAAIVGIFGAFIVTKILANQSAFAEKNIRIQELITSGQKITDIANSNSFAFHHPLDNAGKIELDSLYTEAKHHARIVSDFHSIVSPNPESSSIITASLILILTLFFAGVIYPLSFLPLPIDWKPSISLAEVPAFIFSLQGALLGVVSILFTTMIAMFFVMNIRLKYSTAALERLEKYKYLSEYSAYFANKEENSAQHSYGDKKNNSETIESRAWFFDWTAIF